MREKVGKSRNTVFFQWFVAPEGRKVGSLKRRVRSQLARGEMKNCTPLWREAHFQVKMYKTHHSRTTFGSWDVKKVHAVVARSTFPSQNVQNTPGSDHFWKLRCRKSARRCGAKHISKSKCTKPFSDHFWKLGCRKSARRCGAKHISKSKCTKHIMLGPLWEVEMSKKCTPLWREAHFEVKMYKAPGVRTTFEAQMSLRFASLHYITLHYTPLHYMTLHYTPLHYNYTTTLHYTPLHYNYNYNYTTTLHYTKLHYTTLHYTTLHYTTLHHTKLHYTSLHYTTLHYTTLHYTTLPSTTLHYIPLQLQLQLQLQLYNYTPLRSTTLNYTTLNYTTLHYTTFHYTPLHHTTLHYTTLHSMTLHHR